MYRHDLSFKATSSKWYILYKMFPGTLLKKSIKLFFEALKHLDQNGSITRVNLFTFDLLAEIS